MDNSEIFRDLKFPIGAQDEDYRTELTRKYYQFKEDGMTPFNYGSHYSSGGIVLHYMVRLEPFTNQAKVLQNGTFDVPDRLFCSMENA